MNEDQILDEVSNEKSFKGNKWFWATISILILVFLFSIQTFLRLIYFRIHGYKEMITSQSLNEIFTSLAITLTLFIFLKKINSKSIKLIPFLLSSILIVFLAENIFEYISPLLLQIYFWLTETNTDSLLPSSWNYSTSWIFYFYELIYYLMVSLPPAIGVFFLLKYQNKWLLPLLLIFLLILQSQTQGLFF